MTKRYKGSVEQARKDLRAMGFSAKDAREKAPHLSEMREAGQDSAVKPYSWLGGKSSDEGSWD